MRYAVMFRTHFWDDFAERQMARLRKQVGTGDIYVLMDETNGRPSGLGSERVVYVSQRSLLERGYPNLGSGNMLWFNGDYPFYEFRRQVPGYDFYVQLEYDVVLNVSLDDLVSKAATASVDFVGLTKGEPTPEWKWLATCSGAYPINDIRHQLICLCLFSGRALDHLSGRRLEMAADWEAGRIQSWPMCEGFIATEIALSGFAVRELSEFGGVEAYNFWPPFLESELGDLEKADLIHPVLDNKRFAANLCKSADGVLQFLGPTSFLHRRLRRMAPGGYAKAVMSSEFRQGLQRTLARRLQRTGLLGGHNRVSG